MTQHSPSDHNHLGQPARKKTPEEIEAEISQTRSQITEDIKALGDKLSPENLKQGAKDVLRDAKEEATDMLRTAKDHAIESVTETMSELGDRARHAGHVTTDFVSANAVPLAFIGIGAAWLMLTMRHQRTVSSRFDSERGYQSNRYLRSGWQEQDDWEARRQYTESRQYGERSLAERARAGVREGVNEVREGVNEVREGVNELRERAGEKLDAVRTRVKETASDIGHRANELTHDIGQRANELSHDARDQLNAAQLRTREFARENPVAIGALAVAAGVGVGLLLPTTRPENRLMGPTRDRLLGDAKETAQRVGRTARQAAGDIKDVIAEPAPR